MLEFKTLGSIDLRGEDGRIVESVVQHPKLLALLAYLCACHPSRTHRRDTLMALFWPERDQAHARGALRQELHRLRHALGPGVLSGDRADAVGIDRNRLRCDRQEFEAALDEGRLADALALWRGQFLPGFHLGGGDFEQWLEEERDRLSRKAIEATGWLVSEAEQDGDEASAVSWARRLAELAPYDETAWQRLILLLDRQGDRAGALRAYDGLAARLRKELDVDPSPETRALAESIRGRAEVLAPFAAGAPKPRSPTAHEALERRRAVIGLLPVENQTGEAALDPLALRIGDRLAQGLADAMFADVAPNAASSGVTAVVSATLYSRGELLEVVPRIAEPGEGGRLVEMPRSVALSREAPDDRLDLLTAYVLASAAAHYDPRFDAAATREGSLPIPTPLWEAYLEFLRGSELFGRFAFMEGYRHLLHAFEIDPDFVKAGFFAAIALAWTGQPESAEELVTRAMSVKRRLSDYERLGCEWLLAVLHGRRAEAYRAALESTDVTSHPVVWFLAVREALFMNRPRESLRLLQGIDFFQGWWRNWTEYFEILGGAHHVLGNHRAELAATLDGRARFPGSLEVIRAEVRARAALGESERVSALVDEALTLPPTLSSPAHVAWVAAQELDVHDAEEGAARVRRTALEWLAGLAGPSAVEEQLRVRLLLETGDLDEAACVLATLGPPAGLESMELAGLTAAHRGETEAARLVLASLEGLQSPYLSGRHLLAATGIRAVLDTPEVAMATLRRALAAGLPFGVELHALPTLRPLWGRKDFKALLRPRE